MNKRLRKQRKPKKPVTRRSFLLPGIILLLGLIFIGYWKIPRQYTPAADTPARLQTKEDGSYKILIFADIQDDDELSPYTRDLMNRALDAEKPDLVVLLGDNIYGLAPSMVLSKNHFEQAATQLLEPIVSRNLPFTLVFGNHDCQTVTSEKEQLAFYQSFPGCQAKDTPGLSGTANHNLLIYDQSGEKPVWDLWFFDSGSDLLCEHGIGYQAVNEDQLEWYRQTQQGLPSFVFQHIPVPEMYQLLQEVPEGTDGAITKHGKSYVPGKAYTEGAFGELPCASEYNSGEFAAMREYGNVKAMFFGHDHVNDFHGKLDDIDLTYVAGCGFYFYGNGYERGARVLELQEDHPEEYVSRMIYYSDLTQERTVPTEDMEGGSISHGTGLAGRIAAYFMILGCVLPVAGASIRIVVLLFRRRKEIQN